MESNATAGERHVRKKVKGEREEQGKNEWKARVYKVCVQQGNVEGGLEGEGNLAKRVKTRRDIAEERGKQIGTRGEGEGRANIRSVSSWQVETGNVGAERVE